MNKGIKIAACAVALVFAAGLIIAAAISDSYTAEGKALRVKINEYLARFEAQRETDYMENDASRRFWFHVPEGYLPTKADETKFIPAISPNGTPAEWWALRDITARVEASQLDEKVLKNASTEELVLYCMNYNYIADLFIFEDMQSGMSSIKRGYNGVRELMKRSDAADALIRLYKLYDLDEQFRHDENSLLRFHYLNYLLCQDEILSSLTEQQSRELAAACVEKLTAVSEDAKCLYSADSILRLAIVSQYKTNKDFAALIDSSPAAKKYLDEGLIFLDEIDDKTLGQLVRYFNEAAD